MKAFQYTAKNQKGEVVSGVIEKAGFADASEALSRQGLQILSLNERQQIEQLTPFIFNAVDQHGEKVEGTLKAADEGSLRKKLEEDFGYRVSSVHAQAQSKAHETITISAHDHRQTRSDNIARAKEAMSAHHHEEKAADQKIIFTREPPVLPAKMVISEEELQRALQGIDVLLSAKGHGMSQTTRDRLIHLKTMINLIRENQNKKRWKNLKKEISAAEQIAEREIKAYEDRRWKEHEERDPAKKVDSYTQFSTEKPKVIIDVDSRLAPLRRWAQTIDLPDESDERQVLTKQQYESVWFELQRFTGVLLAFYLLCFFAAYYLKRNGISDHILIRIYDATVFKELVLVLFSLFTLLTVRMDFLPKRVKIDSVLILLWLIIMGFIFW